jgi:hypothetical protein
MTLDTTKELDMSQTFSYDFSTRGNPEEARARLETVLTDRLRRPSGGGGARNLHRELRLSRHTPTSLTYKPKLVAPLPISTMVWLGRILHAEEVNVTFTSNGGDGETRITVSGKVGHGGDAIADQEFWSEALRATS